MQKHIKSIILFIFIIAAAPAFSDEMSAVWARIYNGTEDLEARLSIMQNIVDLHDRGMEPVITEALKEIVYSRDDSMSFYERQLNDDLTAMMLRELGSLKASSAAPEMFKVMDTTEDEFLRSKAIVALGTSGARDYAEKISDHLRYINSDIIQIENNEHRKSIVDACILALERFKAPVGFKPVFYASIGRYDRNSVIKAERALQNMLEDPTDLIVGIITEDSTFETRLLALEVEERSKASDERKNEAANAAIEVSLVYNAATPSEKQYQNRVKVKSTEMIRDLGVASEDSVKWLDLMLNSSTNVNELVTCLQALGTYSSDAAVNVLTTYLSFHNQRRADGYQYKDERAIRECINALASSGNPAAKASLSMVEYSGWSNKTIRMAKSAMKNL